MTDLFSNENAAESDLWALPAPKLNSNWSNDDHSEQDNDTQQQLGDNQVNQSEFLEQSVWDNGNSILESNIDNEAVVDAQVSEEPGPEDEVTAAEANEALANWSNSITSSFNPNAEDIITVTEIPEKEGLLFKHTNYIVKHLIALPDTDQSNDRKVIRRYSDFYWLFEILLKKYPFRIIPELPPKRLNVNPSDSSFNAKRRQGLHRFINQIMGHPILKNDELVLMFLTVPTDLSSWRKQATYDQSEEFTNKKISSNFKNIWNHTNVKTLFEDADKHITESLENFNKLTILIERTQKRYQQTIRDDEIFLNVLNNFTSSTNRIYSLDDNILDINQGLQSVGTHLTKTKTLLNEQSAIIEDDILQKFKKTSDYFNSFKSLFERYKLKGGNHISQLTKRLELNEDKLKELNSKPDVKGYEVDRLKKLIQDDKVEIAKQLNRDWLIKESLIVEFIMFQETQFKLTKTFKDWVAMNLQYSELNSTNFSDLSTSLSEMPLSRTHYK